MLHSEERDPEADTMAWEREIDRFVYKLYGVTADAIKRVEKSIHQ